MKITGWTTQQIDDSPPHILDWILRFHAIDQEVAAERRRAERGGQ